VQQRGDHDVGTEMPLLRRSEDAGEHLLRVGPLGRPIAAAADLSSNDRGPQRLLGAPVGGVERGIDEEAEEGRQLRR